MQIQTKIEMSASPKTKPTDKLPWQPQAPTNMLYMDETEMVYYWWVTFLVALTDGILY